MGGVLILEDLESSSKVVVMNINVSQGECAMQGLEALWHKHLDIQ